MRMCRPLVTIARELQLRMADSTAGNPVQPSAAAEPSVVISNAVRRRVEYDPPVFSFAC
jgi:hypothetical protein